MKRLRLGAVSYLNARPLTWALDRDPDRWSIRYDVPAACAALLHEGAIDLGLIPCIEYLQGDYRLVPGVGIGSKGAIATVALYARGPLMSIRRMAIDTSSRTSVALVKILCRHRFQINPEFVPSPPDLKAMTRDCEAALLIGDPALEVDHEALGLRKVDLGVEWTAMTGMPFIYAAWTGRPKALGLTEVDLLKKAQIEGVREREAIAAEYGRGDAVVTARAARYLSDNVRYGLGAAEVAGLQLFLDYAADLGLGPKRRLEFF